jgi:hypothetical protein
MRIAALAVLTGVVLFGGLARAQRSQEPGKIIGKVSTQGNLIVLTLDDGVLTRPNLFDLSGRTLRFTQGSGGYHGENLPLAWDAEFGTQLDTAQVKLKNFTFSFSGKEWDGFNVGVTGSITFGAAPAPALPGGGRGGRGGGFTIGRFDQLQQAAPRLVNTVPGLAVFFKPRMSGQRYVKEMADRVVVTWTLTEPYAGIQDFTWTPTVNRFQAVLRKDGAIDFSYQEMAARDAIVGVFPVVSDAKGHELHLSTLKRSDEALPIVYEDFHYASLPNPRDMTCSVIKALGDKFDFLAYYSDFRVDNQEAGTPSNGPLGGGPQGGAVTGIGARQRGLASYCTDGRFQWQFVQPVFSGSNQMQEQSPESVVAPRGGGRMTGYNYAMSQIGHEMGHRWGAFVSAKVGGETIPLGPTHWARGLQAPVVFPYRRISEASAMGGGVWQDNFDGTYTQLDDDYYVPATGWSPLDLYLMGLAAPSDVPDFFILRNLVQSGTDRNGHPIFKADRTKVTIEDVIAVEGPRLPDAEHSQRQFNTGMVLMVEHGKKPSKELVERSTGIREKWMEYWSITTGRRSSMTANVK